jgi:hypothetical protein
MKPKKKLKEYRIGVYYEPDVDLHYPWRGSPRDMDPKLLRPGARGRTLAEVLDALRDAIRLDEKEPFTFFVQVMSGGPVGKLVSEAHRATMDLRFAIEAEESRMRRVAHELVVEQSMSRQDAADVLEIGRGRLNKLLRQPKPSTPDEEEEPKAEPKPLAKKLSKSEQRVFDALKAAGEVSGAHDLASRLNKGASLATAISPGRVLDILGKLASLGLADRGKGSDTGVPRWTAR